MATVFLARLSGVGGFQRFVAIKRLHPHLAREHEFIQMFLDEARHAARLHHPHVVPILEIGESEDGYYLVMEYIEGDTLARLMARSAQAAKPLAPQVAVRVAIDTLAGLHAAHELLDDEGKPLEIVHRDVSPQNILIGVDGSARITDFGVARAATRLTTTRSGQLKGKLSYMAPEQARGKPCDRRADIFAMGIVLWETLAKKRLFKGEGEADTLNRVLYEPIPTLRSANPLVHPDLEAVAMKALDREPDARFATCSEMADALEAAARTANVSGVHKDVSTHLDAVIGTDISQQRDAVRAWLARSEPSKSGDPRLEGAVKGKRAPKPSELASATKIEAGRPAREPKHAGDSSSNVSSVSSAVLETVPEAAASSGVSQATGSSVVSHRPASPPPHRSRAGWVVAAISTLLLVAGAAFVKFRPPPPVMTSSPPTGNAPAHAPGDAPSTTTSVAASGATTAAPPTSAPAASATAAIEPVASATGAPSSHTRPGRVPHTTKPAASTPPVASTPVLPDDISHNPYR